MIEVFSSTELWANLTKEEMLRDLKKGSVPKIPADIPKNLWGLICECLNPFTETRIDAKELFDRYVKLMVKMKIPELFKHLGNLFKFN
jgi:hypothetical protein